MFVHTDLPLVTPLTAQQLQHAGVPEGWNFGQADRVRFHELDALNHVNNIVYLRWFEDLRIPYFHAHAITSYNSKDDPQVVLATNAARYFKADVSGRNLRRHGTLYQFPQQLVRAGIRRLG